MRPKADPAHKRVIVALRQLRQRHARAAAEQIKLNVVHETLQELSSLSQEFLAIFAGVLVRRAEHLEHRNQLSGLLVAYLNKRGLLLLQRKLKHDRRLKDGGASCSISSHSSSGKTYVALAGEIP